MAKSAILIEPDAFIGVSKRVSSYVPSYGDSQEKKEAAYTNEDFKSQLKDIQAVSRPLNGIAVKPNTHAFVQVIRADGVPIKVFNRLGQGLGESKGEHTAFASGGYNNDAKSLDELNYGPGGPPPDRSTFPPGTVGDSAYQFAVKAWETKQKTDMDKNMVEGTFRKDLPPNWAHKDSNGDPNSYAWTDWILQAVREQRVEKTQVVETFGDTYLYAFGERPRALEFKGLLMNTLDYNWRALFWENWDKFFRATRLIEQNCRMYIGWDDIIVEGYPLNAAAAETSDSPNAMTFQFTFYVTNYINTSAQTKFSAQRAAKIATIRGGSEGYWAQRLTDIPDKRTRYLEWLGTYGANRAGSAVENSLAALSPGNTLVQQASYFAGSTVSSLADGALKTAFAYMLGEKTGNAFLRNYLSNLTYNSLKFWADIGMVEADRALDAKRGTVNSWFGYVGNILSRFELDKVDPKALGIPSVTERGPYWIGAPAGLSPMKVLTRGSIEAIIGALAYGVQQGTTILTDTVYESATNKGRPATAVSVDVRATQQELQERNLARIQSGAIGTAVTASLVQQEQG